MNNKATFPQNIHPSSQVEISNFKDDSFQKSDEQTSQSAEITELTFCEKFNSTGWLIDVNHDKQAGSISSILIGGEQNFLPETPFFQ